jgi:tetratricopeptide (TPR) repeat protein
MCVQIDATLAGTLLQTTLSSFSQTSPLTGLPSAGGADFGPAALVDPGLGDLQTGLMTDLMNAAYAPRTQPAAQTSSAQRREMLKEVANAMGAHAGGETAKAVEMLEGLIKKDRTYAPAYQSLGSIALDQRDYARAERYFRQAHFFSPQSGFDADAENARVLQRGDDAVMSRARMLISSGETREDGIRLLVGLTQRSEDNGAARIMLADALLAERRTVDALDQYRKALSSEDDTVARTAAARIERLAEAAPGSAVLRNLLGQAQLRMGDAAAALTSFQQATRLAPDDPNFRIAEAPAFVALGRAALQRGDINAALAAFESANDRDPVNTDVRRGYAEGRLARADYRARMGAIGTAITDYAEAARLVRGLDDQALADRIANGAYRAGLALETRRLASGGDISDEVIAFQAAYDLNPDNAAFKSKLAATRNALGDQFMAAGKLKDAAYSYQRAYKLYEHNATYRANTVAAFNAWGADSITYRRFDDAVLAYREAYRTDPNAEGARTNLASAYYERARDYIERGQTTRAISDLREAIHYDPENATYSQLLSELQ